MKEKKPFSMFCPFRGPPPNTIPKKLTQKLDYFDVRDWGKLLRAGAASQTNAEGHRWCRGQGGREAEEEECQRLDWERLASRPALPSTLPRTLL